MLLFFQNLCKTELLALFYNEYDLSEPTSLRDTDYIVVQQDRWQAVCLDWSQRFVVTQLDVLEHNWM